MAKKVFVLLGAGDRDRTGMTFRSRDFKSLASACFATPARGRGDSIHRRLSRVRLLLQIDKRSCLPLFL